MTITQWWAPTTVRISGDSTMRGQLLQTTDGNLLCDFPSRLILIANHQIYTDWLYLWWIGYTAGMHGRINVVLKESLKRIPVIGWGMQLAQFIFLKWNWQEDKVGLASHMQRLNRKELPMWLMMFPEGTNLASCTREKSRQWAKSKGITDGKHVLLPRSTGLQFMLQSLRGSVDYVYDCTIAYEGVARGTYAQDIFTISTSYFGGRPPKSVNMYWRRFRVSNIPLDDDKKFEFWLRSRWMEKDKFIEQFHRSGRFPADSGTNYNHQGHMTRGCGYIETEVKPKYWYEFLQVFAPIGLFALVLYFFYGSLPQEMIDQVKGVDHKMIMKKVEALQKGEIAMPQSQDLVPQHLRDKVNAFRSVQASPTVERVAKPTLDSCSRSTKLVSKSSILKPDLVGKELAQPESAGLKAISSQKPAKASTLHKTSTTRQKNQQPAKSSSQFCQSAYRTDGRQSGPAMKPSLRGPSKIGSATKVIQPQQSKSGPSNCKTAPLIKSSRPGQSKSMPESGLSSPNALPVAKAIKQVQKKEARVNKHETPRKIRRKVAANAT